MVLAQQHFPREGFGPSRGAGQAPGALQAVLWAVHAGLCSWQLRLLLSPDKVPVIRHSKRESLPLQAGTWASLDLGADSAWTGMGMHELGTRLLSRAARTWGEATEARTPADPAMLLFCAGSMRVCVMHFTSQDPWHVSCQPGSSRMLQPFSSCVTWAGGRSVSLGHGPGTEV